MIELDYLFWAFWQGVASAGPFIMDMSNNFALFIRLGSRSYATGQTIIIIIIIIIIIKSSCLRPSI